MENYKKLKRLGSGAFGAVYLLQHQKKKTKCAGKRIECGNDRELEWVLKEIMIMSKLEHKNTVGILDSLIERDGEILQVWLLMEYCNHRNMDDYFLMENRMDDKSLKLDVMMQVIGAVNFIHSKKLVHRDLKPANILIMSKGDDRGVVAKVGDFGIAKLYDTMRRDMMTITGTPVFMAPEIIKLEVSELPRPEAYTERCDVFSLGVTMFALFTNSVVKECISYYEKGDILGYYMVHKSACKIPKTVLGQLKPLGELGKLIKTMLDFEPESRPSAAELISEFYSIMTLEASSSRRHKSKSESEAPSGYSLFSTGGGGFDSSDEDDTVLADKLTQVMMEKGSRDSDRSDSSYGEATVPVDQLSQVRKKKGSRVEDVLFSMGDDSPSSSLTSSDRGYQSGSKERRSKQMPKKSAPPQRQYLDINPGGQRSKSKPKQKSTSVSYDDKEAEEMTKMFCEVIGFAKTK